MSTRRSKHVVTILLLVSAMLVSASYFDIPPSVLGAPTVTLNPTFSPRGALISVSGSGFSFPNGTKLGSNVHGAGGHAVQCNFYSLDGKNTPGTLVISPICNLITADNSSISGSFIVSVLISTPVPNPYAFIINMTDGWRFIKAQATFAVTEIYIHPTSGPQGTVVNVTGSLNAKDTSCSFANPTTTTSTTTITYSLLGTSSCTISGSTGGNFSGRFVVDTLGPGPYTVRVTGSSGDFVQTTFTVTAPAIYLNPTKGGVGTFVAVTGVGFSFSDTSCSLSSVSGFITFPSCTILTYGNGTRQPVGSFNVGNVAQGFYTVQLRGNTGDFAQATFNVTQVFVPTLAISPPDGPRGTIVKVTGTGFRTADASCQLTSLGPGADPALITLPTCSIKSGTVTAQFTVGTSATPGTRAVNVTGSSGDQAGINFIVDVFPTIRAIPATGVPGTFVSISLTGGQFSSGDQGSCTISSSPGNLFSTSNCVVGNSGRNLNGTNFVTSGAASGFYTITVKGSTGDSAFTTFTENFTASLVLSQNNATNGSTITFTATGFSISDSGGCSVLAYVGDISLGVQNFNLITSPVCTISKQVATGSFVVGPQATTNINWNVTVKGSPQNDIPAAAFHFFNVTASVTVSPNTGTAGSVFNFAGAGFSSLATACQLSFHPPGSFGQVNNCGIVSPNSGEVSGSFVAPKTVVAGLYVLNVGDELGHNASTTFTIGTPLAQITISPNIVIAPGAGPPVTVSVSGSGFNAGDLHCVLQSSGPTPVLFSTSSCAISGGFVSGTFQVSTSALPGLYLITVNATDFGDFASNYLSLGSLTTATSTSTTTTSFTSSTATTTLTTYSSISSSLTTTTFTSTGATTIVFPQQTLTTVSGVTTVVSTVTGSTSFPTTGTTTTTQTVTLGQAIQRSISDELGLLGMLLLVVPILLRRLFD
ncbi:MAG: hypothetical protein ABSC50_03070 [Candidatus Bathyarchaeia archaeon]